MAAFPLITHPDGDCIFAWRDGLRVSAARFLFDVAQLREKFPPGTHMLNACGDRYRFTVGLAAAITSRRVSLHPSTITSETIRYLVQFAPDAFCLTDNPECWFSMPRMQYPELPEPTPSDRVAFAPPQIDGDQLVAIVFTSGSTGSPLPHRKSWGALVRNVQAEARACGLSHGRRHAVIGTVPPQHMYGFESTVLMVMQSGNAIVAGPTFFPADIAKTAASVPALRVLVTTPVHLRTLIGSEIEVPTLDMVMSASAPLSPALAEDVEARFGTRLLEIFGSTETGQIAFRRSTQTATWTLFPDVRLTHRGDQCWASGGHIEYPCLMQDVIEVIDDEHFLLHGRTADMVNIAGKRNSLSFLNFQLNTIAGVADGAFVVPDKAGVEAVARLAAIVVAPGLSAESIMAALRERVDPAFLPRPLIMVDTLPRNDTGKLPRDVLQSLLSRVGNETRKTPSSGTASLPIAADHPAFAGHFPGNPIVPGVVLLDEVLYAIGMMIGLDTSVCRVSGIKFFSPVRPGETVSVAYLAQPGAATTGRIRFDIKNNERKIATGTIVVLRE